MSRQKKFCSTAISWLRPQVWIMSGSMIPILILSIQQKLILHEYEVYFYSLYRSCDKTEVQCEISDQFTLLKNNPITKMYNYRRLTRYGRKNEC